MTLNSQMNNTAVVDYKHTIVPLIGDLICVHGKTICLVTTILLYCRLPFLTVEREETKPSVY